MPRPKGSKNKRTIPTAILSVEAYDEKIASVSMEIEQLTGQLKAKKAELKELSAEKAEAEKIALEKKAAEDRETILAAVAASGKSVDEILAMLTPTE